MAHSLYITSAEGRSGKSTVALGILERMVRSTPRVGVFRPIARSADGTDHVLDLLLGSATAGLPREECVGVGYEQVHDDPEAALTTIIERFRAVQARCDAVLVLGSDYTDVGTPTELGFNARVAANLGTPVVLVLGGRTGRGQAEVLGQSEPRSPEELRQIAEAAVGQLREELAALAAIVVNRADPDALLAIRGLVRGVVADKDPVPVWTVPEDRYLVAPSVRAIMEALDGQLVAGDPDLLSREALEVLVAGMSMVNVLARLRESQVVVAPADRPDVLLALVMAHETPTFPALSAVILNGGFDIPRPVQRLLDGIGSALPVVRNAHGTFDTALRIMATEGRLAVDSPRKLDIARAIFEANVEEEELDAILSLAGTSVVTPLMFEYTLLERARRADRHIVLPEGGDDRILRAASTLLARRVARLTILGDEAQLRARAAELGVDVSSATILSPHDPELVERFAAEYARLRAHKGMTVERAREIVTDVSYFGTMMVHLGMADGMVSGAAHTTAHTIRPGFEIIKTVPGTTVVSSVFLMALADRVLVYGDCAVIPVPTAEQLADIAISSAQTARAFGIEPRVAMLSYSTGDSGRGADVDKVREATALVRQRSPELLVEGPIQYDAAADAVVAAAKLPGSLVAGRATVFVFPDLNTGNNTYKAVQRSAGAVAIGPILQGLRKPINDLSRGALVKDIVNTVAITAIQAEQGAEPAERLAGEGESAGSTGPERPGGPELSGKGPAS